MAERLRILIAGVGGQGVLSAGRWVADAAFAAGFETVAGQVHGLAQRGGSVRASVVIGPARSWEIPAGGADVLLGLEPLEAVRALPYVSACTRAFTSVHPIPPASLQSRGLPYPDLDALLEPLRAAAGSLLTLDAFALAGEAGSLRSVNVVMLGVLAGSGLLPFPGEALLDTMIGAGVPALAEVNRKAFGLGREALRSADRRGERMR